jgi:hypothetical protein
MSIYDFGGVETNVDIDVLTPAMAWEARKVTYKKKCESKEIYELMSEEEREVVVKRVRRALEVMHDNIERWLPYSFSLNDIGTCLTIEYNMLVTDIEADRAENELTTSNRLKEAGQELKKLIKELEDED